MIACLAGAALADGDLLRVKSLRHIEYNYRSGEVNWLDTPTREDRAFRTVWDASTPTGFGFGGRASQILLDWGDIVPGTDVTQFSFGYVTNVGCCVFGAAPIELDIGFYSGDNGRDSSSRSLLSQFRLTGLPASCIDLNVPPNSVWSAYLIRVVDFDPFTLDGPDLGDANVAAAEPFSDCVDVGGLTDFSYAFHFRRQFVTGGGAEKVAGPILVQPAAEPNLPPCNAPGSEDAFDLYARDPNHPPADPNAFMRPDVDFPYDRTLSFDGYVYAQFYMTLQTGEPNTPCTWRGCDEADIVPSDGDCIVDLRDLAVLLSNFGAQSGATRADGDIEPADGDGDGDVDLADVALMLAAFGTDCN